MGDGFFPVVDFIPDGVEETRAFLLPDIADKRRFTDNILDVFVSIVSERRIFCLRNKGKAEILLQYENLYHSGHLPIHANMASIGIAFNIR